MSNYHVEAHRQAGRPDQGGDQVAAQAAGPGPVAPPADARCARDRRSGCGCSRSPPARSAFVWPNLAGGFGAPIQIGDLDTVKLQNSHAPDRGGLPGLLLRGARVRHPVRPRPAAVHAGRGHDRRRRRRSTSGRSTSAARTSAASPTRASRTSGSSARATARATTGSGSRRTAPRSGRRRAAWTASRSRSTAPAC